MAPLKAILCYNPPSKQASHTYHLCPNLICHPCRKYAIILQNNITIPIILHPPDNYDTIHMYIDQCNIANVNIDEMVEGTVVTKLLKGRNILWQVLAVHNATYQKPYKVIDLGIAKWKGKLQTAFPEAVIHTYPHMQTFYRNKATTQ